MLKNPLEEKVNNWSSTNNHFREINQRIIHLEKWLFNSYLPCASPAPQFFVRLKKWIENASHEGDQKLLFELVPEIFYIGSDEFNALYRSAYNIEVSKWIIDSIALKFNDIDAESKIKEAVLNTWFCAATDSFKINDFFKINNIPSKSDIRPDWHSLTALGKTSKIKDYVIQNGIDRIVMLEDFVGSGSQVESRIEFLCETFPNLNILVISLVTCPTGVSNFAKLPARFPNLTVRHVIQVKESIFIAESPNLNEPELHTKVREMAERLYPITTDGKISPTKKPYYPLGYQKTGALIVLYNNTPDNTLPIIHWASTTWYPLFKRITRV